MRKVDYVYIQRGGDHNHEPIVEEETKTNSARDIKDLAKQNETTTAISIAEREIALAKHKIDSAMLKVKTLELQANHYRQAGRPKEPVSVDFQLDPAHVPENFWRKDIFINGVKHLMFDTVTAREQFSRWGTNRDIYLP